MMCLAFIATNILMVSALAGDGAAQANRAAVQSDLLNLSARAQQYYWRAVSEGGGGHSFIGLSADAMGLRNLTFSPHNSNGYYFIACAGDAITVMLQGIGMEKGNDACTAIKLTLVVFADSVAVTANN